MTADVPDIPLAPFFSGFSGTPADQCAVLVYRLTTSDNNTVISCRGGGGGSHTIRMIEHGTERSR